MVSTRTASRRNIRNVYRVAMTTLLLSRHDLQNIPSWEAGRIRCTLNVVYDGEWRPLWQFKKRWGSADRIVCR